MTDQRTQLTNARKSKALASMVAAWIAEGNSILKLKDGPRTPKFGAVTAQ